MIHIKNEKELNKKINKFKEDGLKKFHVVSDFDKTLTKCFNEGKKIPSTIALIREGGYLKDDYPKKAFSLFDKYHPIEIDDSISYDYKYEKMKEWWETHEKLLVKSGMHKDVVDDIIKKYPKVLRDGIKEFLEFLKNKNIPLLIFSSGIGNMIEGYLKKENLLTQNIHILSNTFEYDENGYAKGYREEVIHLFNKSEKKITNKKYKELISKRTNVLLLGDSLGDLGMANDLNSDVLSIGFLNEKIDERLEIYKEKFDVVITNDSDMSYVNSILQKLIA